MQQVLRGRQSVVGRQNVAATLLRAVGAAMGCEHVEWNAKLQSHLPQAAFQIRSSSY